MKDFKATLQLKKEAHPIFCKPRSVPFPLKDAISKELDRLEKAGTLQKVSHSDWAAPIVPVPKGDGTMKSLSTLIWTLTGIHFLNQMIYLLLLQVVKGSPN